MTGSNSDRTKAVLLFFNHRVVLDALGDADRGRLVLALMDYAESGALPDFTGELRMAFLVLQNDVDRCSRLWEAECERRSAAGKKSAALRAAKKREQTRSCEEEQEDACVENNTAEHRSTLLNTVEHCSTPFNTVEHRSALSANSTNQNQNKNQNQYQNQNKNQNQNQYSFLPPSGPPAGDGRALEREMIMSSGRTVAAGARASPQGT